MATSPVFNGTSIFLSRSLVPPELFDALHDALRLNGAQIFLCCDPSRAGPHDYHVISSMDHEKFEDLRAKGCSLVGPQCIFSCAKEHRSLPKQGYTCCLAMDGAKVLASGFEKDEKVQIEKLVNAMGGVLHPKASLEVTFVIAKSVLAAKYKWALNTLRKPVVTIQWLHQCWNEHRLVPQEPFRILPFTGLIISITRIPADERKEMERLIILNGGKYSPDLTKKCTHLVSDAPEGDKYLVARRWGHINIVTPKWIDQSIARKGCMDEELFRVCGTSILSQDVKKGSLKRILGQDKSVTGSQSVQSTEVEGPEIGQSQSTCSAFSNGPLATNEAEAPEILQVKDAPTDIDGCVAEDSEDNDLYLSDCRIFLIGFSADRMRRLVGMLRKGGATRHMSLSEKLTHIIVGSPLEIEWKEVRSYAAWGVIKAVKAVWLEDCNREKKEIPVSEKYIVHDLLGDKVTNVVSEKVKNFSNLSNKPACQSLANTGAEAGPSSEKDGEEARPNTSINLGSLLEAPGNLDQGKRFSAVNSHEVKYKNQHSSSTKDIPDRRSSDIFKGQIFCFSSSFPEDRRAEIIDWVAQGGGLTVDDQGRQNSHFIVERHGVVSGPNFSQATIVSSHWIRSCLEDGHRPDVGDHILYSPLPCRVPLPGFELCRFCVSQYGEKERLLLRNLCFVLGAKFTEKLSRRVTHLICKFSSGTKYEAACKWGIKSVTAEWINECIKQDKVVELDQFQPRPATDLDIVTGFCSTTQYPTQAAHLISEDVPSQLPTQWRDPAKLPKESHDIGTDEMDPNLAAIEDYLELSSKIGDMKPPVCHQSSFSPDRSIPAQDHTDSLPAHGARRVWLNRTEKSCSSIRLKRNRCLYDDPHESESGPEIVPPNHSIRGPDQADSHCFSGQSSRTATGHSPGRDGTKCPYDGFSETQTESQIVGYEEDLQGIQMIIDKAHAKVKDAG
ncbi:uncharacterized protein [Aristolochia californica]|uniref:uncharacterized protein isoform X2 n=1 Tax=Aristolochia californica TaxID=171875 RepID=UPI0035D9C22C